MKIVLIIFPIKSLRFGSSLFLVSFVLSDLKSFAHKFDND